MADEVMRVSLRLKEVSIELEGEKGEVKKWKLRELNGTDRNGYLNKMSSRVKTGKDGKSVGIKSFDGFQADLLSLCLYDENGELVSAEDIETLPSNAQQKLFEKAQEISGLNVGSEEIEKNE